MNKYPFPQANDFEKVISVLSSEEDELDNYAIMSKTLGDLENRQVDYYISAAKYLGLIDDSKKFTEDGRKIRMMFPVQRSIALAGLILKDDIFSRVYFT